MAGSSRAQITILACPPHPAMMRLLLFIGCLLVGLTACTNATSPTNPPLSSFGTCTPDGSSPAIIETAVVTPAVTQTPQIEGALNHINSNQIYVSYTHQQADGNRVVSGSGQLPNLTPVDIPLPAPASWVVAIPWKRGSLWVATLANGQVLGFEVENQNWEPVEILPVKLEPGQPPILLGSGDIDGLLMPSSSLASPLTHPIPGFPTELSQIFIDINGDLILVEDNLRQFSQIAVNAQPDARILQDEHGRLLLLSSPTQKYDHGVLGDLIEAASITRIDDPLTGDVSAVIPMPLDLVIEGLAPIWADLNGDGEREIVVTASNAQQGAQILVFSEDGQQIAAGPAIGQGYRWRHQIAIAPFGPNGELELVDILTPHLGGVVEFYQLQDDQLKVVAQIAGYTSHVIGTRNLDMAAGGDFDGDGHLELLLPNQARTELGAIRRTPDGAAVVWALPLDGRMTSNLGAVSLPNGDIVIGVGQENGILLPNMPNNLRIWSP